MALIHLRWLALLMDCGANGLLHSWRTCFKASVFIDLDLLNVLLQDVNDKVAERPVLL